MLAFVQDLFSGECFFRTHFHIYCPGCGGSRALIALLQGNPLQSLRYNPITLFLLLDILLMSILDIVEKGSHGKITGSRLRLIYNVILLAFIPTYFVVRNYLLFVHGIDLPGDFT